jgi:hypothetical protein
VTAPARAAAIWRHRLAIEREAVGHFGWLAARFAAQGDHDLAARARQAAADERDHAGRCQAVIAALGGDPAPPAAARRCPPWARPRCPPPIARSTPRSRSAASPRA